jgi:hypothetical protein
MRQSGGKGQGAYGTREKREKWVWGKRAHHMIGRERQLAKQGGQGHVGAIPKKTGAVLNESADEVGPQLSDSAVALHVQLDAPLLYPQRGPQAGHQPHTAPG